MSIATDIANFLNDEAQCWEDILQNADALGQNIYDTIVAPAILGVDREQLFKLVDPFIDRAMGDYGSGEWVTDELVDALLAAKLLEAQN